MARNRKRARDRRPRRQDDALGLAPAYDSDADEADPLRHAAPDAELADAQLALGRPELAELSDEDEAEFEEEAEAAARGGGGSDFGPPTGRAGSGGGGGELSVPGGATPAPRPGVGSRLITFIQGSWRELQRVQWPDRRQVMQATGVVLGFVIVAGVFLGAADYLAQKLVNFILK